jgi:maltose alpha-D-glucosyltransferase/alpha-amylase
MLLAEANQWPEETAQYFGNGDECHMAFHFPLMPRIYMALAQEDRHPITDIMRQTPEIPEGTQWAIFLRNHDEMTLEMVTDKERDYLWSFYAADRRARINLGIRRRLAPLLDNDRRKIELLMSLLFSMPGTPVLYYGDEIGMGDNIYLGDRDGVRTPMQWSVDRNGGFSRVDPARLFLPAIQDTVYGYLAVNVEAQAASATSLLNWTRRMIAVRRSQKAFGRGNLRFLYPSNRKVLAYLRELDGETLLCVVNVSRAPQAVELDLSEFRGATPVEMTGGSVFPQIGQLPYLLTLSAYGFFWFKLEAVAAEAQRFGPLPAPELFTLVATGRLETVLTGREARAFEQTVAPRFLAARRWFAGKGAKLRSVHVEDFAVLRDFGEGRYLMPILDVAFEGAPSQSYFTPLAAEPDRDDETIMPYVVARLRRAAQTGVLFDADLASHFGVAMLGALRKAGAIETTHGGHIVFVPSPSLADEPDVEPQDVARMGAEQSNSSINLANRMALKIYRRLQVGINPEIEIGRFLTDVAGFANTPPLLGVVEHVAADGTTKALAVLQRYVRNQGDAWSWTLNAIGRLLDTAVFTTSQDTAGPTDAFHAYVPHMQRLGRRTAELHRALATPTDDPAFAAEPMTLTDVEAIAADAKRLAEAAFRRLAQLDPRARPATQAAAARLLAQRADVFGLIDSLTVAPVGAIKTRIHGDFHLGQVLVVKDDVIIIDFEGEPARPLDERRAKASPLRDVAGMLRSFAYAIATASRELSQRLPDPSAATAKLEQELSQFSQIFLDAYMSVAYGSPIWIEDAATRDRLMTLHLLAKALYEIDYEAGNRPDWIDIPIAGVQGMLALVTEPV